MTLEELKHRMRVVAAILRRARVHKVKLKTTQSPADALEAIADAAEELLTDAIIRERL